MTQPDLDELVALARRDRPAPSALLAVARSLRVPFVAMPVAAIAIPGTALAGVAAKVGLSRLALLGWGTGSAVAVTGVVAAVALHQPAVAPPPVMPAPTPAVAQHAEPQQQLLPAPEPEATLPAPNAERRLPSGTPTWDEPQLIERARKALASDPRRALSLTQEHQRRFPTGALGVEREVIALEALARTGQTAEARRRAQAFTARYPKSIHTPQVRALLARLDAK